LTPSGPGGRIVGLRFVWPSKTPASRPGDTLRKASLSVARVSTLSSDRAKKNPDTVRFPPSRSATLTTMWSHTARPSRVHRRNSTPPRVSIAPPPPTDPTKR